MLTAGVVEWLESLPAAVKIATVLFIARALEPTLPHIDTLVNAFLEFSKGKLATIAAGWQKLAGDVGSVTSSLTQWDDDAHFSLGLVAETALLLPTMALSAVIFYLGFQIILPPSFPRELTEHLPTEGLLGLIASPPGAVGAAFALVEAIAGSRLIDHPSSAESYTMSALRKRPVALSCIAILSLTAATLAAIRTYYFLEFPEDGNAASSASGHTLQLLGTFVVGGMTVIVPWVLAVASAATRVTLDAVGSALVVTLQIVIFFGDFSIKTLFTVAAAFGAALLLVVLAAYLVAVNILVRIWHAPYEIIMAMRTGRPLWRGADEK
jgi:hypothetical protein